MPTDNGFVLVERGNLLLDRLEALRPDLIELAEAIVYDRKSLLWARKHFGEEKCRALEEFVAENLWTQWGF
ncbi:MAG: hypothetical protein ABIN58_11500 [candidate division WOR-3 bacterium]